MKRLDRIRCELAGWILVEIKKGDKIMKLSMKERKFTIRDKFSVQDENGRD